MIGSLIKADALKKKAFEIGFDLIGVADARDPAYTQAVSHYEGWLERSMMGEMRYLANHLGHKREPNLFLEGARSVVVAGALYASRERAVEAERGKPRISNYAQGADYHALLEEKLSLLASDLKERHGGESRVFVDRHPVLDRVWARLAGLGWFGKNTCLIDRKQGSYFFIGGFFSTLGIEPDQPTPEHCGKCRLCIEACPTGAILEPPQTGLGRHVVDSRKCISYHTIENRGDIPAEIAEKMGPWVVGCDICQSVCPWNNPRVPAEGGRWFQEKNELVGLGFKEMAGLTPREWESKTERTAISRLKHGQFQRNVALAARGDGRCQTTESK